MEDNKELVRFLQESVEGLERSISSLQESKDNYQRFIDGINEGRVDTRQLNELLQELKDCGGDVEVFLNSHLYESYC